MDAIMDGRPAGRLEMPPPVLSSSFDIVSLFFLELPVRGASHQQEFPAVPLASL